MSAMTPRQRVLAALRHQVPDQVPFELTAWPSSVGGLTPRLLDTFVERTGHEDPTTYWQFPTRLVAHRPAQPFDLWRTYADYYPESMPVGTRITEFGLGH